MWRSLSRKSKPILSLGAKGIEVSWLILAFLVLSASFSEAEALEVAQAIASELPPPQDLVPSRPEPVIPPGAPAPRSTEEPLDDLPLESSPSERDDPRLELSPSERDDREITVTLLYWEGNSVISTAELAAIPILLDGQNQPISAIVGKKLAYSRLVDVAQSVADYYAAAGYRTSGAIVDIPKKTRENRQGYITIQVIEGQLDRIAVQRGNASEDEIECESGSRVRGKGRLDRYVRSRLGVDCTSIVNVDRLRDALALLQLDPLIDSVNATLAAGTQPGRNELLVRYEPAGASVPQLSLDNGRVPSVGSFQREFGFRQNNLLGAGDRVDLGYTNTDGSDRFDLGYFVPLSSQNASLSLGYSDTQNDVIEEPFDDIDDDGNTPDIESESRTYEVTFRQPLIRKIESETFREIALGLTASLQESEAFLLDIPFPLSPGADEDGQTRIFALRFSQELTQQDSREVLALRSQFSFGFDAFDATINRQIPGVEEIPDSRFFAWRGQGQYVRLLGGNTILLVRSNVQLADRALVPLEQFSVGGLGSVRGYRQDTNIGDNGVFASVELQIPVLRAFRRQATLRIVPFVDYGRVWNSSDREEPNPPDLSSLGIGLQWQQGDSWFARIDWGIPLVETDRRERTWQENGIYFTVRYAPRF